MNTREILLSPIALVQWVWSAWMTALTETRIRRSLRVADPLLAFVAGGTPFRGHELPDSTEFLYPEMILHAHGFNRHVCSAKALLRVCLDVTGERRVLLETTVTLTARPTEIGGLAIRWKGTSLEGLRGQAVLRVYVAELELATFPFTLVSTAQILDQLRVSGLCLNARLTGGKSTALPRRIVVNELESIAPSFSIESPTIAPGSEVGGRLLLLQANQVLAGAPFQIRLEQRKTEIKTARVKAPSDIAPGSVMELRVELAGVVRERRPILTLDSQPITTFDGSLTTDA